jgi:putative SOS response-associated peptidase YedK
MCGRYVSPDEAAIEREFNLVHTEWQFPPSYNVAPTQSVPVIRSVDGKPRGSLMRWGLIPYFARGVPPKYSTINARVETVQTAASYKGPWSRGQRCLVVAEGFYEWQLQADGKSKVPYYITTNDQPIFAFAGLWDSSRTRRASASSRLRISRSQPMACWARSTTPSTACQPSLRRPTDREAWLTGSPEEAWETLTP